MCRLAALAVVAFTASLGGPAQAEVLIGVAGPMTGKNAWFGEQLQRAAELASAAATPAGAENVLRWASASEALTFDPHAVNHFPTIAANLQVYEPLVDFNSNSEIEPALAVTFVTPRTSRRGSPAS
jgi:ABC-type transport system substrate-binding protein